MILNNGMKMPTRQILVVINPNGLVEILAGNTLVAEYEAVAAADVRPVRSGTWIDMGDFISCSSCNATRLKEFESDYGKVMRLDARANFCPNCGARMEES